MGTYLNPGNSGFEEIRGSYYVDKSGLIRLINHTIGTKQKLTCISRPRRFGKSLNMSMSRNACMVRMADTETEKEDHTLKLL